MTNLFSTIRGWLVLVSGFGLGFLQMLTLMIVFTRNGSDLFLPVILSFLLFLALAFIPAFEALMVRIILGSLYSGGLFVACLLTEPETIAERSERFSLWAPELGLAVFALAIFLLFATGPERNPVRWRTWISLFIAISIACVLAYSSGTNMQHHLTAKVSSDIVPKVADGRFKAFLPRMITFGFLAMFSYLIASTGGATRFHRIAVIVLISAPLAILVEWRQGTPATTMLVDLVLPAAVTVFALIVKEPSTEEL